MGKLIAFVGPSGSGKTVIADRIAKACDLTKLVTFTSRERRPGEVNGRDYHFISPERAARWEEECQWAEHDVYNGHHYGITNEMLQGVIFGNRNYYAPLTIEGVAQYKKLFVEPLYVVGIKCSRGTAARRLIKRYGEAKAEEVDKRMVNFYHDFDGMLHYSDIIVNNDIDSEARLDEVVRDVISVVQTNLGIIRPMYMGDMFKNLKGGNHNG